MGRRECEWVHGSKLHAVLSPMILLDPQTLSARENLVGVLGCCLNPCRKACCLYDCDLAFSNTLYRGESAVVYSCLIFSVVHRAPKAPFEKSPPPSLLTTSTLRRAICARYFEKYVAVSSLVRRKNTLVNREKSSLRSSCTPSPPATVRTSAPMGQPNAVQLA